ncbi:DUF4360 domain-containing protein [Actinomadura spongiicola]|uniref:DUF4360 domain-containing protein n=1 Tax=Actinomadura spongiicola TaxID=2303421 RepID=A0A372GP38_9ACTN|nr:DUF4360 domain-containing protein [Actinomadura spongiicola]
MALSCRHGVNHAAGRRVAATHYVSIVPEGFTYGIVSSSHRGYARIQGRSKATIGIEYYFFPCGAYFWHPVNKPFDGFWEYTGGWPHMEIAWKPCNEDGYLSTRTELQIEQRYSDRFKLSSISIGDETGLPHHDVQLAWKTCP